ncbi:MAG: 4Fe-4S binding protein [Candidatus Methanoperedens sp.]|nr:4Fe-4S binding protein [Candidatus Methanoperedens sp.]
MRLKELDLATLKKSGYMKQRQKDLFAVRLRIPCGNVTSEQLQGISGIARKYGSGYIHITTRQGIQIPDISIDYLDIITEELESNCTPPGSFGSRVRNIVACPGNHECCHGIIDTYSLGILLDKEFFCEDMPVKMKFSIAGCPNACAKPQENDIGVMGVIRPAISTECTGCGACTTICPQKAILVENGKASILQNRCKLCGYCLGSCPEGLIFEGRRGLKIFIGGKVGRNPRHGREFIEVNTAQETVAVFRKIIEWSKHHTNIGERFGSCLDRLKLEDFNKEVVYQSITAGIYPGEAEKSRDEQILEI